MLEHDATAAAEVEHRYRAHTRRSAALAAEARRVLPSGIVHDSRYLRPHGLYLKRAAGAHKWAFRRSLEMLRWQKAI